MPTVEQAMRAWEAAAFFAEGERSEAAEFARIPQHRNRARMLTVFWRDERVRCEGQARRLHEMLSDAPAGAYAASDASADDPPG